MPEHSLAENVLGTIGTVMWAGQLIPQIWKSWHEKSTEGLSGVLMLTWSSSAIFLGVYNIVEDINIPLIVQPQLFGALAALSWAQCMFYGDRRSFKQCSLILAAYLLVFAGLEVGMTYAVRAVQAENMRAGDRFSQFFGIMSAVLIALGLIPQYIEIYRRREVLGISMLFMAIDIGGGVFSLLSLIFRDHFDAFAASSYIGVIVLDGVIVVCAIILNPRARRRRALEQDRRERPSVESSNEAAIDNAKKEVEAKKMNQLTHQSNMKPSRKNSGTYPNPSPSDLEKGFQPTITDERQHFERSNVVSDSKEDTA